MRKLLLLLLFVTAFLITSPSFGSGTCTQQSGGGVSWFECVNTSPSTYTHWVLYSPGTQMCGVSGDYYKSTGTYGSATLEWSFGSESTQSKYAEIVFTLDLKNSHSSSLNRMTVLVYNDTDSTVETIATIDGSSGDICSNTYRYLLYRPAWDGSNGSKNMRLSFQASFWDTDAQFNVNSIGYMQWLP